MNRPTLQWIRTLALCLALPLTGCGDNETAPVESSRPVTPAEVEAPLEPLPPLRTGASEPEAGGTLTLTLRGQASDTTHQYLAFELPPDAVGEGSLPPQWAALDDAGAGDLGVLRTEVTVPTRQLLVRRALARRDAPLRGALYAHRWSRTGPRFSRWTFDAATTGAPGDASTRLHWIQAFAAVAGDSAQPANHWFQFAAGRIRALDAKGMTAHDETTDTRPQPRSDLKQLMDTTSGMLSVQEALQHDRGLRLPAQSGQATVPIAQLTVPALAAHPFAQMQAALAQPDGGTPEPLAAAVPAAFWYARVDDLRLLLRLLDEADAWLTPLLQILESNPQDRGLSARYQTQLGLRRSGMAKLFGHTIVGQVALTGSDPYLREGSDLTLLFQLRQPAIFDAELARHLAEIRAEHPTLTSSERRHGEVVVQVHTTPDGTVRQQRAQVGELALVSNSSAALDQVLDAIAGTSPRLADEADLKYLLARDPGTHQGLIFLSDRFIASAIAPGQKVLAARRQQALSELLAPGHAALLYGWLFGRAPANTEELLASGLLDASELNHANGATIDFQPGQAARSVWGSAAALTPLIDLPPIEKVTVAEQKAYQQFVQTYQQYWRQFIDPVAVRLDLKELAVGQSELAIDVRVLPLISGTDYREIDNVVGQARVSVPAPTSGLQSVWAVGADAQLRRELDGLLRASSGGQQDVGLGWLGNWVAVGADDRAALVELLSYTDASVQLPPARQDNEWEDLDLWRKVGRFPVYAAAEVRNPLGLVATLAALRTMVNQVAPGMIEWGEVARHRELPIVRVGINKNAPLLPDRAIADAVALHYLTTGSAFVVALDLATLKTVADRLLDGAAPTPAKGEAPQFVFDARTRRGAPLWTALLWALQGQAYESQNSARRYAEALLRGDPVTTTDPDHLRKLGFAYLGFAPVTAQGDSRFVLQPEGVADASTGSRVRPVFIELPAPGSPVAGLMARLRALRGEVSFDAEPEPAGADARSLHARLVLGLSTDPVP